MKLLANQKGYSIIMVPPVLLVILTLFAFAFDYGRVLLAKHQLQAAADAATIAGSSMIKVLYKDVDYNTGSSENNTTIIEYASENLVVEEADKVFDLNYEDMKLENKGINITDKQGTLLDGKFSYKVLGEIDMSTTLSMLTGKTLQSFTVFSESKPEEIVSSNN